MRRIVTLGCLLSLAGCQPAHVPDGGVPFLAAGSEASVRCWVAGVEEAPMWEPDGDGDPSAVLTSRESGRFVPTFTGDRVRVVADPAPGDRFTALGAPQMRPVIVLGLTGKAAGFTGRMTRADLQPVP